jgi:hypothetical protein
LWLHRQAFDAARAAAIVQTRAPHNYWEFTDYLFAHQSEFFNNAFYNKTEGDLVNLFGGYAQQFGVPKATFNAYVSFRLLIQQVLTIATIIVTSRPTTFTRTPTLISTLALPTRCTIPIWHYSLI